MGQLTTGWPTCHALYNSSLPAAQDWSYLHGFLAFFLVSFLNKAIIRGFLKCKCGM